MRPSNIEAYDKAIKIIKSCVTLEQLDIAHNYLELINKRQAYVWYINLYKEYIRRWDEVKK